MSIGAVCGAAAPELQTAWTRAEAACAARHRGDAYYQLLASSAPSAPSAPDAVVARAAAGGSDAPPRSSPLASGFTIYM